jgi:hypothetical protein
MVAPFAALLLSLQAAPPSPAAVPQGVAAAGTTHAISCRDSGSIAAAFVSSWLRQGGSDAEQIHHLACTVGFCSRHTP